MTSVGAEELLPPRWHQALAYAVTGRRRPELGRQQAPDLSFLCDWLRGEGAGADRPWTVPADLLTGIGAAQFWAALTQLRAELAPPAVARPSPVLTDRPFTPDERRLMSDVPPHHGS